MTGSALFLPPLVPNDLDVAPAAQMVYLAMASSFLPALPESNTGEEEAACTGIYTYFWLDAYRDSYPACLMRHLRRIRLANIWNNLRPSA